MKLIYQKEYFERYLYLIEHKNKLFMVYKSSGLNGTVKKGSIIPFLFLEETNNLSYPLGYIFKEMFYNNVFINHHKDLKKYNLQNKMEFISNFIKTLKEPPKSNLKTTETKHIKKINSDMYKLIKNMKFFDLKLDKL